MKVRKLSGILATAMLSMSTLVVYAQPAEDSSAKQAQKAPTSKAHVLTRAELDKLLSQPQKVLLIDVRRPDEISSVGGFPVYLSVQLNQLKDSLAWIPRDRLLVTISNHAARASRAADVLTSHGFQVAGAAGAQTYEKQGGMLMKIAIPPQRNSANAAKQRVKAAN